MNHIKEIFIQEENKFDATTDNVVWLADISKNNQKVVGSKAARLSELLTAGFPVPAGFCLTKSVYSQHVLHSDRIDLENLAATGRFADIQKSVLDTRLSQPLVTDLVSKYRRLLAQYPGAIAVRSSSTAEDLHQHSFAGLYETILNVADGVALLNAIRRCWASYWSEEAVRYREEIGLEHTSHGMAVLVQTMIQPKLAGVLFTQDPLNRESNALVIEVVRGNAETLVSGEVKAERFLIDRKTKQPLEAPHLEEQIDSSFLSQLASLGLAIEQHRAAPQDIEWAIDASDHLWILQTRPITGLDDQRTTTQINLKHDWLITYDEPFSPLGCDIAERRYHYWVRAINVYFKTAFEPRMHNVDGFLYYKPSWRSPAQPIRLWIWFWRLARWLGAPKIYRRYVKTILPAHRQRLAEIERQNISNLNNAVLLEGFNASIKTYLDFQFTSYAIGVVATTSASFLDQICRLWFGQDNLRALDFLSGLDDASVERELTLNQLGQTLSQILAPAEIANLDYASLLALKDRGNTGRWFWDKLQTFLNTYGYVWADRYPRDPAWKFNQEALVASLIHAAQTSSNGSLIARRKRQQQQRRCSIEQTTNQLSRRDWLPLRRMIFQWLLRRAERFFPYKEDRNHHVYQAAMVMRKYAQEIGRRLKVQQILAAEDDVFFLTWEEIQKILSDPNLEKAVSLPKPKPKQIEHRKRVYHRSRQQALGQETEARWAKPNLANNGETKIELAGEACSPGVAKGSARLISGLGEMQRVQPGEILVCSQLRPAWASVFSRAGGVVIEMGSLLSHGSTLAREYDIPAVINVSGLTQIVREGDQLTVDGHLGKVTIERIDARAHS